MTRTAVDTSIPASLKRTTNTKGITLSAGPSVVATGAKTEPKKPAKVKASRVNVKTVKAPVEPKAPKAKPAPIGATGTVIDPTTGEAVAKVVKSIVPSKFKERYSKHNGTCGDDMANELKAATTMLNADKRETLDWEALKAIATANKLDVSKYETLNNGQKRMNVGNKLRGLLKAGTDVVVGTRKFKAEDVAV